MVEIATSPAALRARVGAFSRREVPPGTMKRAAVLVPIVLSAAPAEAPELLFLVRPVGLASHSGQVAFPGGRIDASDPDARAAALREAHEEVGIAPELPEVIGALDDLPSTSGYLVTPIVAILQGPLVLLPSPHEVAATFQVPLPRLADPAERRTLRGHFWPSRALPGSEPRLHFWVHTPAPIWGVTGQILMNLLRVLQGGP